MKVVKMKGGLGNQMFQYSFAKFLELELKDDIRLDFHQYKLNKNDSIRKPRLLKYNVSLKSATKSDCSFVFPHNFNPLSLIYKASIYAEKKFNKNYYFTKGLTYEDPQVLNKWHYFDGYWQSHKYIDKVEPILRKEFVPNYKMNEATISFIKKVSGENTVFIGVRKGDYTKNKSMQSSWGSFDSSYYRKCMAYIADRVSNPVFIVFSNDIEWCKSNLDFSGYDYYYRENEDIVDDFEELQIMSSCKHAIIVNSTFNWWGAWLNKNPEKIICCPQKWYFNGQKTEILPDEWVKF